ncbi:imidazole glycerol phosphate synthase subunit HisH [Acetobacteraceae bacterium H6797]|nr:imidazole glycerol phosphate synthase subunit HisH [Acetobacteraceae bacterium H6797]
MSLSIAIVDPGSGNLASLSRALIRSGEMADVPVDVFITTKAEELAKADRIVLPGQGAFAACRRGLDALPGMVEALEEEVRHKGKPLIGVCVGMQILAQRGLEHGVTDGLGWFKGEIAPMDPQDGEGHAMPLPQMGWNGLDFAPGAHPLLAGLEPGCYGYFVHSYAMAKHEAADVLATTDYGGPVVAMIARGNVAATQFHVEKSQLTGLRILANFLRWEP